MWRCAARLVLPDVSKERIASITAVQESKKNAKGRRREVGPVGDVKEFRPFNVKAL
jgi:hypothetical protein